MGAQPRPVPSPRHGAVRRETGEESDDCWGLKYGRSEITTHVYKVSTASQPKPAHVGPLVHDFGTPRC